MSRTSKCFRCGHPKERHGQHPRHTGQDVCGYHVMSGSPPVPDYCGCVGFQTEADATAAMEVARQHPLGANPTLEQRPADFRFSFPPLGLEAGDEPREAELSA